MANPDPQLAAELFDLVERDQGYAYISDGIEVLTRAEIIQLAHDSKWRLSLQARGILHPEDWERMMGLPTGRHAIGNAVDSYAAELVFRGIEAVTGGANAR